VCQCDFGIGIESGVEFAPVGNIIWIGRHHDVAVGMAEIAVRWGKFILESQLVIKFYLNNALNRHTPLSNDS